MSAPAHDGWPQEGSVWEHWSDLLLATQLAALREGYTSISKVWKAERPQILKFRCFVSDTADRTETCQKMLVYATAEIGTKLDGRWIVQSLRLENLKGEHHKGHVTGVGRSQGFETSPAEKSKLSIGQTVADWNGMHALEGALRSAARLEGRYLRSFAQKFHLGVGGDRTYSYFFSCVLGERCDYYIRFGPHEQQGGEGWECEQLCLKHSCSSIAAVVSDELASKLSFWPKVKLQGDYTEATGRRIYGNYLGAMTITDEHLGDYPVLKPGQTVPRHVLPPPDPSLTDKLESKRSSLSKTLDSLASTRQEIVNLRTKISLASILDETDEVKKLSAGMGDLETKREKKLRKVEKKKRKIEKIKEKIKAKQMEQKKVEGTKSKPAKMKKVGKGKKEKGKV